MKSLIVILIGCFGLIFLTASKSGQKLYVFNYENVLGTSFELKVLANNEKRAETAEAIALSEIDRLDFVLSSYKANSEFSKWQRSYNQDIKVSDELFEVLSLFDQWRAKTGGALNPATGIASSLWKDATNTRQVPMNQSLTNAVARMQLQHWELNREYKTARRLTHEPLVLNTFVKSYIIKKVSDKVMIQPGIEGAVVNIGGDMVISGDLTEEVRIVNPAADSENDPATSIIKVRNKAVATSGNYRRGFHISDQWFSHILDPRTGKPVSEITSATVVSDCATDAGALATAFNIFSIEESAALARELNAEFRITDVNEKTFESTGWNSIEISTPFQSDRALKNNDFELRVEIEIASFMGRVRRPFVAVWIENKKKEPVKNLAIWYNKPRWLPDLKRWYTKNYSSMNPSGIGSVTGATRSPGKYAMTWTGFDDSGNKVPDGTYTLYIEAAREHGTYQLIKRDFEWNSKARHIELEGGLEISSASIDLHKLSSQK